VDRLSKYGHFIPLKHPYTSKKVAEVFAKEVVRLHGIPQSIVKGSIVHQSVLEGVVLVTGHNLKNELFLSSEDLWSNGGSESVFRTYLRCFASKQLKTWSYWVSWAELWYNTTTFHGSTGTTPFEAV